MAPAPDKAAAAPSRLHHRSKHFSSFSQRRSDNANSTNGPQQRPQDKALPAIPRPPPVAIDLSPPRAPDGPKSSREPPSQSTLAEKQRAPESQPLSPTDAVESRSALRKPRRYTTASITRPKAPPRSLTSPTTSTFPQNILAPEPRSPPGNLTRKPPASHSSHGIETSHGPPIALITRGGSYPDRRSTQSDTDPTQQLAQLGLSHPSSSQFQRSAAAEVNSTSFRGRVLSGDHSRSTSRTRSLSRPASVRSNSFAGDGRDISPTEQKDMNIAQPNDHMERVNGPQTLRPEPHPDLSKAKVASSEDLFLKLAQDSPTNNQDSNDITTRAERRRSRLARAAQRQSLPANSLSSPFSYRTANGASSPPSKKARMAQADTGYNRRSANFSSTMRAYRDSSPLSPAQLAVDSRRTQFGGLSPQSSFSKSTSREPPSLHSQIPQFGRRRPSVPEPNPSRLAPSYAYRSHHPTTLDPNAGLDIPDRALPVGRAYSRADGSSVDSTTAPSTVWDELDELKSRIKKLELTGRMPSTSAAAVSNASGERPRTATTTVTTISSSPNRAQKATSIAPSEPATQVGGPGAANLHPLLHTALAKCKPHLTPSLFRALEATASDALELAALTSSSGPQGTAYSTASIGSGGTVSDRQLRRKADSMCRSLTELCIALSEVKMSSTSPAIGVSGVGSRRGSLSLGGDIQTPSAHATSRVSVEPDSEAIRNSPSRALDRIEARRTSMLGLSNSPRAEPKTGPGTSSLTTPTQSSLNRTGTSLLRTRRPAPMSEDEDEHTLRAPSRAFTDFTRTRPANIDTSRLETNRLSREYSVHQKKLPDPPNSATLPPREPAISSLHNLTSLRRSTVNGIAPPEGSNIPTSLLRDGSRRIALDRIGPLERSVIGEPMASEDRRTRIATLGQHQYGGSAPVSAGLARAGSLQRKLRSNHLGVEQTG